MSVLNKQNQEVAWSDLTQRKFEFAAISHCSFRSDALTSEYLNLFVESRFNIYSTPYTDRLQTHWKVLLYPPNLGVVLTLLFYISKDSLLAIYNANSLCIKKNNITTQVNYFNTLECFVRYLTTKWGEKNYLSGCTAAQHRNTVRTVMNLKFNQKVVMCHHITHRLLRTEMETLPSLAMQCWPRNRLR